VPNCAKKRIMRTVNKRFRGRQWCLQADNQGGAGVPGTFAGGAIGVSCLGVLGEVAVESNERIPRSDGRNARSGSSR